MNKRDYRVEKITLNGTWELFEAPITASKEYIKELSPQQAMQTPVPGDIHQGLIDAGLQKEPTIGLNAQDTMWTREKSWWLKKTFEISAQQLQVAMAIELNLKGLDSNAWIYINDRLIGEHHSTFRPFITDITAFLKVGTNNITVRLSAGVENIDSSLPDSLGGEIPVDPRTPKRFELRRVFVRKPQYSWGWDWAPESSTAGITDDASINIVYSDYLNDIQVKINGDSDMARLDICVSARRDNQLTCANADIKVTIYSPDNTAIKQEIKTVMLQTGRSFHNFSINVEKPELWWPSSSGPQPLYKVTATLLQPDRESHSIQKELGIRFVELDIKNNFAININKKPIFCKGANFVPADLYYGRAEDEKYRKLVKLAKEANFNMLRIWGGGLYLPEAFYDECDRLGIMVWHDFMFACAPYPDYDEAFCDEVRKEISYQLKRLNHHPSIVLWCGDNENILNRNSLEKTKNGAKITGQILPEAVNSICSQVAYWFSSPYGTGDNYKHISCDTPGNCHIWKNVMLSPNMEDRINFNVFDNMNPCFVSEYGFPGACTKQSTIEYTGNNILDIKSAEWDYHYNPFARGIVENAIEKYYADSISDLSTEKFIYYAGIIQGKAYQHSLEAFRQNSHCNGALFWMFNDCWGEVGWSIVDYYMRHKASYWFVKRAFTPIRMVIRNLEEDINVTFINDTNQKIEKDITLYWYDLKSNTKNVFAQQKLSVMAHSSSRLSTKSSDFDPNAGFWLAEEKNTEPATLFMTELKNIDRPAIHIQVKNIKCLDEEISFELTSDNYAHAVELNLSCDAIPCDNYFDLIPGIKKKITIKGLNSINPNNIVKNYC